jgi:hypothetical protein
LIGPGGIAPGGYRLPEPLTFRSNLASAYAFETLFAAAPGPDWSAIIAKVFVSPPDFLKFGARDGGRRRILGDGVVRSYVWRETLASKGAEAEKNTIL